MQLLSESVLSRSIRLPNKPDPVVLSGKYVILEPLVISRDSKILYEMSNGCPITLKGRSFGAYNSSDLIWRYMFDGPFKNEKDFAAHLPTYVNASNGLCFCIFDVVSNQQIGIANFINNFPLHLKIELGGIWYSPIAQRTNANTEAIYLMLKHLFNLGYRRIEWKCDVLNERSRQSALRMGFKFEGIQESHMIVKGCNRDTAWFRMLESEWSEKCSKNLKHFFMHQKKIKIILNKANKEDKDTIQNLGRFYVYEMSRYCGFLPTWEIPANMALILSSKIAGEKFAQAIQLGIEYDPDPTFAVGSPEKANLVIREELRSCMTANFVKVPCEFSS